MSESGGRPEGELGIPTKIQSRDPAQMTAVIEALLRKEFPSRRDIRVVNIEVPGAAGVNNETFLLDIEWSQDGETHREGLVLRLETSENLFFDPPFSQHFKLYEVMGRTRRAPAPRVFGLNLDDSIFGRPFFFMERVEGKVPGDQPLFHAEGWMHERSLDERKTMWRNTVDAMVRLHGAPVSDVAFLDRPNLGVTGFEQELGHYFDYMTDALQGQNHRVVEYAADWLRKNLPDDTPTGFSWGDSRPQNVIFNEENEVVAILDWDMASLAGPEADLAWWTMMDLSSTRGRGLERLDGWGAPGETIELWQEIAGRKLKNMDFHFVFSAFRSGVIVMRLTKMLDAKGHLPPGSKSWINNNIGIQFLASLLDIPPMERDSQPWPGLD